MGRSEISTKIKWDRVVLMIAAAVAFAAWMPMVSMHGINLGADGTFHLSRIESLADALRQNIFPVKIHPEMEHGCGYGCGLFYSDVFLYFPALLMLIGVHLVTAYKIYVLAVFFLAFMVMYESEMLLTDNYGVSLMAAGLAVFSSSLWHSVYVMFSLGNYSAMVFMPAAIAGFTAVVDQSGEYDKSASKRHKYFLMILGFSGLMFTHTLSLLFTFCVCTVILLMNLDSLVKKPVLLLKLAASAAIVLGITAEYWMPMAEQFNAAEYKVSVPYLEPVNEVESFSSLVLGQRYGLLFFVLLIITSMAEVYSLFVKRGKTGAGLKTLRNCMILTVIAWILPALASWRWFWMVMNRKLMFVQVPARFMYIDSVITIMLFGMMLTACDIDPAKVWKREALIAAVLVICAAVSYSIFIPINMRADRKIFSDKKITDEYFGDGDGGMEWLPLNMGRDSLLEYQKAYADNGDGADGTKLNGDTLYQVYLMSDHKWYDIPYVYYKGYHAYLDNGEELRTDENTVSGKVRVYMPENAEDIIRITVCYRKTAIQKLSYIISFISIVGVMICIWWDNGTNKKNS